MPEALVMSIVRQAVEVAIIVSMPMLVAALAIGVLVSLFQTVTSIQDTVLGFLPRVAVVIVVFVLTFPWMLRTVASFTTGLVQRLPELVR